MTSPASSLGFLGDTPSQHRGFDSSSSILGGGGISSFLNSHIPGDHSSGLMNHQGPASILGSGSLLGPSSILGPASLHMGRSPSSLHSSGGASERVSNLNLNINPSMSNIGVGLGSPFPALSHGSPYASNLAVPMTPLAGELLDGYSEGTPTHSAIPTRAIPSSSVVDDLPTVMLQNIVSTVNLGVKLDLQKIALHARNAEYNPKRFAAVVMRIREPRTTALIFSSGKMVCTGAKSEEASRLAARKFARIVQKLGFAASFSEFKVQNMVGSTDMRHPIQLEGLCITHAQFSTYEPELFPGLIYRMVKPRVVLLIFVSGKVVITGAKAKKEIDEAFAQIYPTLKGFKK